ncbi:MAG: M23 family metallopeptidase [Ferruginibacter sp.]
MHKTSYLLIISLLFISAVANCQLIAPKNYPQGYFQWPVGAKIGLAANFGELRPNHYHMGLDCKTDQKVNLPVYAAAQGFISKVKIDPTGFGRSIMIDHPNGLTTLYAHLNAFYPELEKYVTDRQYLLKQWNVTLTVPPNLFKVNKGDLIAYSGNTGGSQGPHLHFEIRDTRSEKVLNPLLFGFPIQDDVPPVFLRIAVYDRRMSTYEQTPKIYSVKKVNGIYQPAGQVMVNTDKVSFAITALDRYTASTNPNGIYTAELYDNDSTKAAFEMDSISYDDTRYLNAHIDYKTRSIGGPFLQHLSRLPGYLKGIYTTAPGDGVIELKDDSEHSIKILATDANGNSSTLQFSLKRNKIAEKTWQSGPMFYPGFINVIEKENVCLYLPEPAIYDSFHFKFNEIRTAAGMVFQLHNTSVPIQTYFPIMIRGDQFRDTGKVIMKRWSGSKIDYKRATSVNGWYRAYFREFGNFQLISDSIPPSVVPVGFRNGMVTTKFTKIKFAVWDNTEEIQQFTALLDGNWLRFTNDKGRNFVYDFDERCGPGEHELVIIAEDQAGNKTEKRYQFKR